MSFPHSMDPASKQMMGKKLHSAPFPSNKRAANNDRILYSELNPLLKSESDFIERESYVPSYASTYTRYLNFRLSELNVNLSIVFTLISYNAEDML